MQAWLQKQLLLSRQMMTRRLEDQGGRSSISHILSFLEQSKSGLLQCGSIYSFDLFIPLLLKGHWVKMLCLGVLCILSFCFGQQLEPTHDTLEMSSTFLSFVSHSNLQQQKPPTLSHFVWQVQEMWKVLSAFPQSQGKADLV